MSEHGSGEAVGPSLVHSAPSVERKYLSCFSANCRDTPSSSVELMNTLVYDLPGALLYCDNLSGLLHATVGPGWSLSVPYA